MKKVREGYKMTELGEIPKDWEVKELQSLYAENIRDFGSFSTTKLINYVDKGVAYLRSENFRGNKILFDSINFITKEVDAQLNKSYVYTGNVLFTKIGNIGCSTVYKGQLGERCNSNATIAKITLNDIICNKVYVSYFLNSLLCKKQYIGNIISTPPRINLGDINKFHIILSPIQEQQKIADILSTVDEHIEETESLIEKIKELKKGLMQRLLTKGIGHTRFKKTEVGEIPVEWEVRELIEIVDKSDKYSFTGGPFGSDLKSCHYTKNGVKVIQLQNIGEGYFNNGYSIYTTEEKADELASCNIYPGEIIIAKMAEPVARACKVPDFDKRYLMCSDGIRVSVDKKLYNSDYIMYAINSNYFRKNAITNSTGTTRLRIGLNELKSLPVLIPSLKEQKKISSILITVDHEIGSLENKKSYLIKLKDSLMQKLLTGKIRVKIN